MKNESIIIPDKEIEGKTAYRILRSQGADYEAVLQYMTNRGMRFDIDGVVDLAKNEGYTSREIWNLFEIKDPLAKCQLIMALGRHFNFY